MSVCTGSVRANIAAPTGNQTRPESVIQGTNGKWTHNWVVGNIIALFFVYHCISSIPSLKKAIFIHDTYMFDSRNSTLAVQHR